MSGANSAAGGSADPDPRPGHEGEAPPAALSPSSPASGVCGEFGIRIARDGTWFYHDSPIGRKPLVKLFASVLSRDEAGAYWLTTPAERGTIVVEDAPFVAVAMTVLGEGRTRRLRFRTGLDDEVEADPEHPLRIAVDPATEEPSPYVLVRGRLEARILRPVFYDLVELAEPDPGGGDAVGVWSGGCFFRLGRVL